MALGGLGLLSGIALRQGVRARYDRAVQVSGAKAVGSLLALLAKFGHVGIPFAGMLTSFGAVFKHNFVLLEFDPNNSQKLEPSFVLDPWPRARPDIFDFEEYEAYWPIDGVRTYE